MRTTQFLEQLKSLNQLTNVFTKTPDHPKAQSVIPGYSLSSLNEVPLKQATWNNVTLLLDQAITSCTALITAHERVKLKLESYGELTASKKSEETAQLEKNKKKILELQGILAAVTEEISYHESQQAKSQSTLAWLRTRSNEIDRRVNSCNHLIPFYGIAYAVETNKMIDDYNRKRNDWLILNESVNKTSSKYYQNLDKQRSILSEMAHLTAKNLDLQGRSVDINELLTIVNHLIVMFQNFLIEIQQIKYQLDYHSAKTAEKLNELVDKSYQEISQAQQILTAKINEYRKKLPVELLTELKTIE